MDTQMPVMDGYQAIMQIQRLQAIKIVANSERKEPFKTVIIGLSAGTLEENQSDILAVGCDDILQKPFELESILEKIAQHLKVRYVYEIEEKADFDDEMSTIPLGKLPLLSISNHSSISHST